MTNEVVKEYVLSGSINATITSADQYIFYYNDTKVVPGEDFKVTLTVNFEGGVESSSVTKNVRIPAPRKFGKILLITIMKANSMTFNKGLKDNAFPPLPINEFSSFFLQIIGMDH